MAQPRPDLPNDKKSAKDYVLWLAKLNLFERIYIHGSRSPLRDKKVTKDSDWDFVAFTKKPKLSLIAPREANRLHADLVIADVKNEEKWLKLNTKVVEIWPNDKYGVFK